MNDTDRTLHWHQLFDFLSSLVSFEETRDYREGWMVLSVASLLLRSIPLLEVPLGKLEPFIFLLTLALSFAFPGVARHQFRVFKVAFGLFHRVIGISARFILILLVQVRLAVLESLLLPLEVQVDVVVAEKHAAESICDRLLIRDMLH